jgi:hypothetical protein
LQPLQPLPGTISVLLHSLVRKRSMNRALEPEAHA